MDGLAQSMGLFVLAGLCEIGGGWLVWQWWRARAAWPLGLAGAAALGLCLAGVAVIMYTPR